MVYLQNGGITDGSGGSGRDVFDIAGRTVLTRNGGCTYVSDFNGQWLSFNGSTGFLGLTLTPPSGVTSATLVIRLKAGSLVTAEALAGTGGGALNSYWPFSNGLIYLALLDSFSRNINGYSPSVDLTLDHTFHLTSAPGSGNYKLYIDGIFATSGTQGVLDFASLTNLFKTSNAEFFGGKVGGIKLWYRALSASEVAQDYADPYLWMRPIPPKRFLFSSVVTTVKWPGFYTDPAMSSFDALGI